jgi:hypothetical protein
MVIKFFVFSFTQISLSDADLDTRVVPAQGMTYMERFVSPRVLLQKIQENSMDKVNFFTKQKVQWMVVNDPVLVQVITRIEEEKKQAMRKMGEEKKN